MTTNYPGAIDGAPAVHADVSDAVLAIENELGVNPSGAASTVAALLAALPGTYADAATTPTLEELEKNIPLPVTLSATATIMLGPCTVTQRIGALLLSFSSAVAASDTNYWTFDLIRYRVGAGPVVLATKTTQITNGEGVTANQGWAFDNVSWTPFRYLLRGDILALRTTKTGAPANLTDAVASIRYEPNVTTSSPIISDTFTRGNSTAGLGTSETGQPWFPLTQAGFSTPVFGIASNQASLHTAVSPGGRSFAVVETGARDYSVSTKLLSPSNSGILVRGASDTSGYINNNTTLFRVDAAQATTTLGTFSTGFSAGDTIKITCNGSVITVYRNGSQVLSVTDATYSGSLVGFRASSPTLDVPLWDDFTVTVP